MWVWVPFILCVRHGGGGCSPGRCFAGRLESVLLPHHPHLTPVDCATYCRCGIPWVSARCIAGTLTFDSCGTPWLSASPISALCPQWQGSPVGSCSWSCILCSLLLLLFFAWHNAQSVTLWWRGERTRDVRCVLLVAWGAAVTTTAMYGTRDAQPFPCPPRSPLEPASACVLRSPEPVCAGESSLGPGPLPAVCGPQP